MSLIRRLSESSPSRGVRIALWVGATLLIGASSATATNWVTGASVRDGSLSGVDIRNGSVTGRDVQRGTLTGKHIANGSIQKFDLSASARNAVRGADGARGARGARGAMGATGAAGIAGAPGATGAAGTAGPIGATGPQGPTGTQGPAGVAGPVGLTGATGLQGIPGAAGSNAVTGCAHVYNVDPQVVALEADVSFSHDGVLTAGFAHVPGTSQITTTNAGTYELEFSVSGVEPNQFAIFVNGVSLAGSIHGSGAGTQQNNGRVIAVLAAGDVVTLRNHSSAAAVNLQTLAGGIQSNSNASLTLLRLG